MSHAGATWVGVLDLDEDKEVAGINGDVRPGQRRAKVLIRMHRASLGCIYIPTTPLGTFASRVRSLAEESLAEQVDRHVLRDAGGNVHSARWEAQAGCPRSFSSAEDTGLTIIVCTRDRPAQLLTCIRALQASCHAPVEILVVDNAPSDSGTRDAVESLARDDERIRYACAPRPGLSRARNHGLTIARFDLVAFTDDDVVVDKGWASAIVAGFTADPEAACVTGLVASGALDTGPERYFDARYAWGEAFEPRRYDLGPYRDASRLYPFKAGLFGTGANFAVRRDAVSRLGGFDPLLGAGSPCRGGEDLDMFLRIILSGARICFIPAALAWHRNRTSTQELAEQVYSYGLGLGAYLAKHMRNPRLLWALLRAAPLQLGEVLQRLRSASGESQLRTQSRRLAVCEARGVVAGAVLYLRSAWRGHHS